MFNTNLIDTFFSPSRSMMIWFWVVVAIAIVLSLVLALILWKKGKTAAILSSFGFGILLMISFMAVNWLNKDNGLNQRFIDTTKNVFQLVGQIFIILVVIMLPLFLFMVIINFILSDELNNINKRTYLISFMSLIGLSLLGVVIAIMLSPLLYALPESIFNVDVSGNSKEEAEGFLSAIFGENGILNWFTKWWIILLIIFSSIYTGTGIRLATKNSSDRRDVYKNIFFRIGKYVTIYFKYVVMIVPFAILTRLAMLGMQEPIKASDNLLMMGSYMVIWWIGALIILCILIIGIIILSPKDISLKKRFSVIGDQILVSASTQSTQASLFETQENCQKLGICEEISRLTPTKGTFMGMIMCNGFSPMLILTFTIAWTNDGQLDWKMIFFATVVVMSLIISTSGQGSADYTVIMTAFGVLGLNSALYLSVLLPVQELNERTIRTSNNALGHVAATLIVEKYHKKFSKSEVEGKK